MDTHFGCKDSFLEIVPSVFPFLSYSINALPGSREARRLEATRNRGLARMEDVSQRVAAFAAKEEEKLAGLRALLTKGPITIAKRTT